MGVKVGFLVSGFVGCSMFMLVLGLFMPQHTLSFFTLYGVRVARMWTYMGSVQMESSSNDFCRALRQVVSEENLNWCDGLDAMTDIQDVQHRFCSPVFERVWPSFCQGLSSAYAFGMGMILVVVLNLGLQGIAIFLLVDYGNRKANPRYRKASMLALAVGLCMVVMMLTYYGFQVLTNLSSVQSASGVSSVFSAVLSVSKGTGVSAGYLMLWTGALFQFVALCLYSQAKTTSQEHFYQEGKALREHKEELEAAGYGAAAPGKKEMSQAAPGHAQGFGQQMGFAGQPMGMPGQPQGFAAQPAGFVMQQQQQQQQQQQGFAMQQQQQGFGVQQQQGPRGDFGV